MRLFKVVTAEEDADATNPEVFSGPATKPSLEKPIVARTSIYGVPDTGKEEQATPRPPEAAAEGQVRFDDKAPN